MKKNKIFFNSPAIVGNEIRNISKLKQFSSNGKYSKKCSIWLKKILNVKKLY